MNGHLEDEQIAAAVAGVELEERAAQHLAECVTCRAEVNRMQELLAARRQDFEQAAPDWERLHQQIMDRLPAPVVPIRRSRWLRPLVAMAAVLVVAVGVAVLVQRSPALRPEVDLEGVLAAVDSTLDDQEGFPGFEAFYGLDGEPDVAELDDQWDGDIPGFEALESIVPGFEDIEAMLDVEAVG